MMKLFFKISLVILLITIVNSCQQNTQLLTAGTPQSTATLDDINSRDKIDEELKRAIENQNAEEAKKLLQQVAAPVPLIKAVDQKDVVKVKELLEQGTNPNAIEWWAGGFSSSYHTALWVAIKRNNTEIINLLLQYGADINKVSASFDLKTKQWIFYTALSHSLTTNYSNYLTVKANTPYENNYDINLEMVKLFVLHGASISSEKNVLFLSKGEELLKYLIENGADINEKFNGTTPPLMYWNIGPDLYALKLYLKYGANPYLEDNQGKNAFDAIGANKKLSSANKKRAIELMKEYGAKFIQTPLEKTMEQERN